MANQKDLVFDTKVTVLNRKFNKPISNEYPIATLQLNVNALIEIDQVKEQVTRKLAPCGLPQGIAVMTFYSFKLTKYSFMQGPSGEMIELFPN